MKAENYLQETHQINGVSVTITTYRIGEYHHCHIQNQDPGATIARAKGKTLDEAKLAALKKAQNRLQSR